MHRPVKEFTIRRVCSPIDYGAVGDNVSDDTVAVQLAVGACSTIIFPSGKTFLIGAVQLNHSNLHLLFEVNATVVLQPGGDGGKEAGSFTAWCSGCIYENITVTGAGNRASVIDGQGWRQWSKPRAERSGAKMMVLHNVRRVCVRGMLFKDSASFHLLMRGDRLSVIDSRVEAGIENCAG